MPKPAPFSSHPRIAVHERRLETDRLRKRAARADMDALGELHGSRLDGVLLDAVALMLRGRRPGDPVRNALLQSIGDALVLHGAPLTPTLQRRIRSRIAINAHLRLLLDGYDLADAVVGGSEDRDRVRG